MKFALKVGFIILLCTVFVQADVSHLGYNRYRGQRLQTVRLQRLESSPTPYPAAGFRPNREFGLPRDQPLFPLVNQHSNRPQVSSGFDSLSEPERPQLIYGSPEQEPRFRPQTRPQNFNGFNNLAEPQQHEFVVHYQPSDANLQPQQSQNSGFNNVERPQPSQGNNNFAEPQQPDFQNNNFAEPQQSPDLLYGAPNNQEQEAQTARLRQQFVGRLQQAQRLEQLQQQTETQRYRQAPSQSRQQQFFNSPQLLYSAPSQQRDVELRSESRNSRLIARKPARLTANREESEDETDVKTSETVEEIETTTKAESKKTVDQPAGTPVVANTGLVNYYPAAAFGFVQPGYVASSNYQTVQPITAAYTAGSPFLSQPYGLTAAAPAQLQAW